MKIPSTLIQNFMTSEFSPKLNSSGEYVIRSPFVDDKKGKLYVNKETGQWIDFKASGQRTTEYTSGSFLLFVKEYFGFSSNSEAIKYLVDNYNFEVEEKTEEEKNQDNEKKKVLRDFIIKDGFKMFNNGENLGLFGQMAYKYVLDRKLDPSYYPKLGYVFNSKSKFDKRVVVPFFEDGKIVYFITRTIDPKNMLRYMNPNKLDSKEYVFNIDKINEEIVMCEGVFDAMSITADQPTTCLLSADIGVKQLGKIYEKKPKTIIYVTDNDATGHIKMQRNINKIITYCPYQGLNIYIFNVPNGCKDLNDMKIKTGKNYILKKECIKYGDDILTRKII
jgi:hypothetical protein